MPGNYGLAENVARDHSARPGDFPREPSCRKAGKKYCHEMASRTRRECTCLADAYLGRYNLEKGELPPHCLFEDPQADCYERFAFQQCGAPPDFNVLHQNYRYPKLHSPRQFKRAAFRRRINF